MIFLELFLTFLKIGAFTFGGGYAMLPLVQDAVLKKVWLPEEAIVDFIAVSESTPGPFAINIATYVGTEKGGLFGAFCSTLGVVLPSFIIILIVAKCFEKFKTNKYISGCMTGLKPAVIGLISSAILGIAKTVFFPNADMITLEVLLGVFTSPVFYLSAAIFLVMTFLAMKKVNPIYIIVASAVIGIAAGYALGIPV